MTQEEFDALDQPETDTPAAKAGVAAVLRAQSPVRLAAVGLALVAAVGFGGTRLLNSPSVQVSQVQSIPGKAVPVTRPTFPTAPAAADGPISPSISALRALEQTQAKGPASDRVDSDPGVTAVDAAPDCTLTVASAPLAGAMVGLDISAPCDAGLRADVHQGDLRIAVALDAAGTARVEIPALSQKPEISVRVQDRTAVSLDESIADLGNYTRIVLQWQDDMGLELHAFEGPDADYATAGHVSAQTPRTIANALSGNGGFMLRLGDPTLPDANVAIVYTAPAGQTVDIGVDAPVTAANCTRTVFASTIRVTPGADPRTQDLTLTMPGCDAVGEFVMLGDLAANGPQIDLVSN